MTTMTTNQRIDDLAREIREHLSEHNVLDALAHHLAVSRLEVEALKAESARQSDEIEALRLTLRARDLLLPLNNATYLARTELVIDAAGPVPAEVGLHWVERDGRGVPFRWSGPSDSFEFVAHVARHLPMSLALHVPMWGRDRATGLQCEVDGQAVELRAEPGHRVLEMVGELPVRAYAGPTRIRFTCAAMHEAERAGVTRQLGVPVLRLSLQAITDDEEDTDPDLVPDDDSEVIPLGVAKG